MTTPLVAGVGVAAAALFGRELVKQYIKFKAAPAAARAYYKGGFQSEMTRREAALILGLREPAAEERRAADRGYGRSGSRERPRERYSGYDSRDRDRERRRGREHEEREDRPSKRSRAGEAEEQMGDPEEVKEDGGGEIEFDSGLTPEEIQMMAAFGIPFGFDSTQGKHVEDASANSGGVKVKSVRAGRQYMNRRGGFNRPLPAERTGIKVVRD